MKILMITPYLASIYGGPAKVVTELSQGLGNLNVSIDLITTNANGVKKLDVPLQTWIDEPGYRVQYFNCWHRNDLIISFPLLHWLFNNVCSYHVVHTNHRFSPLILLTEWVCQFHRIPYVSTPHGMLEPWAMSYKGWKKKFYYSFLEKAALIQASAIHTLCNSEANTIKSLGFQHAVVIPNGVSRQEFETIPNPDIFYQQFPHTRNKTLILFLGRIDPKKGLDLLAQALAKVRNQFPNVHLIVAGPDSIGFLPTVQNYFAQAGCLEAVTFTGMLTGNMKYAALATASLYVAPSYSEGFSMSVLEGMASGLPCVITTGCNFLEAAAAKVAYTVDANADAITNALIECLSNPQQAQAMGKRAREFIFQNYTWEKAVEKLSQTYTAIVNQKQTQLHQVPR